jgi:sodium transport system permease protein
MKPKYLVVLIKELKESLRDKRALVLLAVFIFMYPALLGFMLNVMIKRSTKPEREGIELVVIGGQQAPTLMTQLKQKNVLIKDSPDLQEEAIGDLLRKRQAVAVLRLHEKYAEDYHAMRPARVELWYDSAIDKGRKLDDIETVLQSYSSSIAGARLLAHGVSPVALSPVKVQKFDTGTSASRSATVIGALLGMLFIPAFMFCYSVAVDSTAGERERRSLEVLMAQPARPVDLIGGKLLAGALLSFAGLVLEMSFAHGVFKTLPLEEIGMSWRLSLPDLGLVLLASSALCVFASAFEIALAMNAKSFKEAQSTVSIALFLPMIPAFIVPIMELTTAGWMYAVPVLSNITLMRELAKGTDVGAIAFLLTFLSAALPAAACFLFATMRLKSEKYVLAV